jgi:hypothetical protein
MTLRPRGLSLELKKEKQEKKHFALRATEAVWYQTPGPESLSASSMASPF